MLNTNIFKITETVKINRRALSHLRYFSDHKVHLGFGGGK